MTLQDAITRFDDLNENCEIPNRRSGGTRSLSTGERNVVVTHVTNAVRAVSRGCDPLAVDLTPYLEVLVDAAKKDAEVHGRSSSREASSVRLFLVSVEGCEYSVQRRVTRDAMLPGWHELFDALRSLRDENGNRRTPRARRYPGYLFGFQNFLLMRGVRRPEDLPRHETVVEWAEHDEVDRQRLDNFFCAYRVGREAAQRFDLPDLAPSTSGRHRGLLGLPNIDQLLEDACDARPSAREILAGRMAHDVDSQMVLVRILAPLIWEATDGYLTQTNKSDAWNQQVAQTTSCLVAELIRMGHGSKIANMDHLDLFEQLVPWEGGELPSPNIGLLERRLGETTGSVEVSLFRAYLDRVARASFERSPIHLAETTIPAHEVPWYTDAAFNEASALWSVTDFVYGNGLGRPEGGMKRLKPATWKSVRIEYDTVREYMKGLNRRRRPRGHKDKSLVDFTWAQAICQGVFYLRKEVHALRDRYHLMHKEHGPTAPVTAKARRKYVRHLEDFMIYTVLLDDGLRVKNYVQGRTNIHFLPEIDRREGGEWKRITGLKTHFRGYDSEAGLKMSKTSDGRERDRKRDVSPGIVDMELLTDYWLEARVETLVTLGYIPSVEAYKPAEDRWAFFLSKMSNRAGHGGYSAAGLSKRFGRVLHKVMKHALGRSVPRWRELSGRHAVADVRRKWRAIFNAHITRLLIATYTGGLREKWGFASWLTDDEVATLENHYLEVKSIFQDAGKKRGIEHPHHFDDVVDRLWDGDVLDWDSFDPNNPSSARWL